MYCPFQKEVVQEQSMPTTLTPNEPPKVVINESFKECEPHLCMAGFQKENDDWACMLCGKEY